MKMKRMIGYLWIFLQIGGIPFAWSQKIKPIIKFEPKRWGFVDQTYQIIKPVVYTHIVRQAQGFVVVKNRQYGLLNSEGKVVVPCQYQDLNIWKKTPLMLVKQKSKWGLINPTNGEMVLKPVFTHIGKAVNGKAIVDSTYKFQGLINTQGEVILRPSYPEIHEVVNGLRLARNHQGMYGYLDENGQVVIDFIYKDARPFNEKLALVTKKDHTTWVYIDRNGRKVRPGKWPAPLEKKPNKNDFFILAEEAAVPMFDSKFGITKYPGKNKKIGIHTVFIKDERAYHKELLKRYFEANLRFPRKARRKRVRGEVKLQFIVSKKGEVHHVQVLESLGYGCDKEAIRLLKAIPKWKPAKYGKPVISLCTLNVPFIYQKK